jgi:hypothetical protein
LVGDLPQEDVAKYGKQKEGSRKSWDSPFKLVTYWSQWSKHVDFRLLFFMMWRCGPIFSKKALCTFGTLLSLLA